MWEGRVRGEGTLKGDRWTGQQGVLLTACQLGAGDETRPYGQGLRSKRDSTRVRHWWGPGLALPQGRRLLEAAGCWCL